MDMNDYQERSKDTAVYPNAGTDIVYPALGLCDEAGEVAGKVKKYLRGDDGDGPISDERKQALHAELGDVLWYIAQLATALDVDLARVAEMNLEKLASRKDRNMLKGDGDNR